MTRNNGTTIAAYDIAVEYSDSAGNVAHHTLPLDMPVQEMAAFVWDIATTANLIPNVGYSRETVMHELIDAIATANANTDEIDLMEGRPAAVVCGDYSDAGDEYTRNYSVSVAISYRRVEIPAQEESNEMEPTKMGGTFPLTSEEISELAWNVLGDKSGTGRGWVGYRRDHELVVKGIRAGMTTN